MPRHGTDERLKWKANVKENVRKSNGRSDSNHESFFQRVKTLEQTSMIYSDGRKVRENMMCDREFTSKKKRVESELR
jgi:hypothetical protein